MRDFSYIVPHEGAEQRTAECFRTLLHSYRPTVFLDIGANVGGYSWVALNHDPAITTWLFEPDETNVRLLTKTIAKSGLKTARLFPVALSSTSGTVEFLVDDASGATGSIAASTSNQEPLHARYGLKNRRTVKCEALDSFLPELQGHRILMKIDVEGAEDAVLSGAREFLTKLRPLFILECFEPEKMRILKELRYRAYDLSEGCNWLVVPEERSAEAETAWLPGPIAAS
ncbi:MAG: FkbM family methyltransferase [Chthoniobacteraceae bacterium]